MITNCVICGEPLSHDRRGKITCGSETCTNPRSDEKHPALKRFAPVGERSNTGIFETLVARDGLDLVLYNMLSRNDYLKQVDELDDIALDLLLDNNYEPRCRPDDLLGALPSVYDAARLRQEFRILNDGIAKMVGGNYDLATVLRSCNAALAVGDLGRKLKVRPHEPDAVRGRKVHEGSRVGSRAGNKTKQKKKQEHRDAVEAEYRKLRKAHPKESNSRIAGWIVTRLEEKKITISERSVRNYIRDFRLQ